VSRTGAMSYRKLLILLILSCAVPQVVGEEEGDRNTETSCSDKVIIYCPDGTKLCIPTDKYQPGIDYCSKKQDGSLLRVASALTESMIRCPERVWPGYDWRGLQVLLVDSEKQLALLWNDQRKRTDGKGIRITSVPYADLPSYHRLEPGSFHSKPMHGMATLGVGVTSSDIDTISLAIHEGFHNVGQDGFHESELMSSWGNTYPAAWEPRYMRQQIIAALSRVLFSSDAEALGAARYWYDRMLKCYPEEVRTSGPVDIVEGTAEYVETVGTALGVIGCESTEAELITKAKQICQQQVCEGSKGEFHTESEPYRIGALAGLLLRQRDMPQWQELVARGTTPLDLLLKDVQPLPQQDDQELLDKVKKYYEEENRRMGRIIETFFRQMESPEYYILAIPVGWAAGSFSTDGFVRVTRKDKQRLLVLGMSVALESPDRSASGEISGLTMLEISTESPRGAEPLLVFPIEKKACVRKDGRSSIDTAHLKLRTIKPEVLETDSGREWLFLQPYSLPTPSPAE